MTMMNDAGISSKIKVLFTEPEAYDSELRSDLPFNWDSSFESIHTESELINSVSSRDYEVVFGRIGLPFNDAFFKACSKIKILATPTTGLDHVDLEAAYMASVYVLSLRGELDFLRHITSTAEHAWSLLLACNRNLPVLFDRTRKGSWMRSDLELHQISGQTLGIIGMGRLGTMVAEYARAFRMRVIAYDPHISEADLPVHIESLCMENLLLQSDHIILTASYSHGDPVILGREQILAMKPGSTFVNVARGELVDETALVEAIDLGILRAVGVDVLPSDSRWSDIDKVRSPLIERSTQNSQILITPHVGGYAVEAVMQTRRFMVDRVDQVIQKYFESVS